MKASTVLATAATLVDGDRRQKHGDPKVSFGRIAQLWSARLGVTVTPSDVCWMMSDVKFIRSISGENNDDDYVDGAGYIALASEVSDGLE